MYFCQSTLLESVNFYPNFVQYLLFCCECLSLLEIQESTVTNLFLNFRYYKATMGRAARNHGGTGGHGCVPLPGERPNFNRHIISDKTLFRHSLVKHNNIQPEKSKKLELVKQLPGEGIQMTPISDQNKYECSGQDKLKPIVDKENDNPSQNGSKCSLTPRKCSKSNQKNPKPTEIGNNNGPLLTMQPEPAVKQPLQSEQKQLPSVQ